MDACEFGWTVCEGAGAGGCEVIEGPVGGWVAEEDSVGWRVTDWD